MLRYAVIALLALIALYGTVGIFSRPVLDDLCITDRVTRTGGIVPAVSDLYWNWSGNVIGLYYQVAGAAWRLYRVAPIALLALWVVTFAWFFWEALALAGLPRSRLLVALLGALLTLMLIDVSANIGQTLYWLNGTANYGPTGALFVMFLTMLLRIARLGARRVHFIAAVLLVFSAVLGQITMVIYCVGLLAPLLVLAAISTRLPHRRDLVRILIVALTAGAVGSAIVILTPGNAVRQDSLATVGLYRMSVVGAVVRNLPFSIWMLSLSVVLFAPVAHLLILALGHLAALVFRPHALEHAVLPARYRRLVLVGGPLLGLFIFYLGSFASIYSMGVPGPPRAWAAPQSLWVVVVPILGYVHGLCFRPTANAPRVYRAIALCVAAFFVVQLVNLATLVPLYRNFAEDYDARMAMIEASMARGETHIVVPAYRTPVEELMVLEDDDEVLCLRYYYKFDSLRVVPRGEAQ